MAVVHDPALGCYSLRYEELVRRSGRYRWFDVRSDMIAVFLAMTASSLLSMLFAMLNFTIWCSVTIHDMIASGL